MTHDVAINDMNLMHDRWVTLLLVLVLYSYNTSMQYCRVSSLASITKFEDL
jgi:hypothetical protein